MQSSHLNQDHDQFPAWTFFIENHEDWCLQGETVSFVRKLNEQFQLNAVTLSITNELDRLNNIPTQPTRDQKIAWGKNQTQLHDINAIYYELINVRDALKWAEKNENPDLRANQLQQYTKKLREIQASLIQECRQHPLLSKNVQNQIESFYQQLDIWTVENVHAACLNALTQTLHYYKIIYHKRLFPHANLKYEYMNQQERINLYNEIYEEKIDANITSKILNIKLDRLKSYLDLRLENIKFHYKLEKEFLPKILNYINSLHILYGLPTLYYNSSTYLHFRSEAEKIVAANLNEIEKLNTTSIPNKSIPKLLSLYVPHSGNPPQTEKKSLQNDIQEKKRLTPIKTEPVSSEIQYAKLALAETGSNLPDGILEKNPCLQKALAASYLYLASPKSWFLHGIQGKKAAQLFIKNLCALNDKSEEYILHEALNYIQGKGKYSWLWNNSSGHHKSSRIAFLYDAGLFKNPESEIGKHLQFITSRFFQPFHQMSRTDRKNITEHFVKSPSLKQSI